MNKKDHILILDPEKKFCDELSKKLKRKVIVLSAVSEEEFARLDFSSCEMKIVILNVVFIDLLGRLKRDFPKAAIYGIHSPTQDWRLLTEQGINAMNRDVISLCRTIGIALSRK